MNHACFPHPLTLPPEEVVPQISPLAPVPDLCPGSPFLIRPRNYRAPSHRGPRCRSGPKRAAFTR